MPDVSILVRAKNDESVIGRTLRGIVCQKTNFAFEVVVCDDGSTDRTHEIAEDFPVRFVTRPAQSYKPGVTLNALVREARGKMVVFNNSDAVPLDENWLSALLEPLGAQDGTPQSVFSFANQKPRANANWLVRKDHERAFGDGRIQATWPFFFSLASSATWRQLLLDTPFDEDIQYSEDVEWTWRNSRRPENPVRVVYCPKALCEHSHNYTFSQMAKRFRGEGMADHRIFGRQPSTGRALVSAARESLRDIAYLLRHALHPNEGPGLCRLALEIPYSPLCRLVQRLSHNAGLREAVALERTP